MAYLLCLWQVRDERQSSRRASLGRAHTTKLRSFASLVCDNKGGQDAKKILSSGSPSGSGWGQDTNCHYAPSTILSRNTCNRESS